MTEQLQRTLIETALESAVSLFGNVIAHNKTSIVFENPKTGERKKMTYKQMEETLNDVIDTIRKEA